VYRVIFVFLQVLLVHGILQSTFLTLLDIRYKGILTVIIIVLLFSNFHLDLGIAYGLVVIPPGIFWSILFLKQRSLLSVYISHCIIGIWALFILSYVDLIKVFQDFLEIYKP
jgi:membrane protease YdiL (CAAX protease family)